MSETKNPKPPWADEPTPLVDGELNTIDPAKEDLVVDPDFARDLERRLRYAARKLGTIRVDCIVDGTDGELDPELLEQMLGELEEVLQG